jgi:hypothetical protein
MNLGFNTSIRKLYSASNFLLISNLISRNHVVKLQISKVECVSVGWGRRRRGCININVN